MEEKFEKEAKPSTETTISKQHKVIKYALGATAILVCIGFVVGIVTVVTIYYTTSDVKNDVTETTTEGKVPSTTVGVISSSSTTVGVLPSEEDIFNFVPEANGDGVNILFYHAANEAAQLELAVQDKNVDMVEGDVNLRYYGSPSQKDEAVMNNPPEQIADVTLNQWLDAVVSAKKAIKLDLRIDEVVPITLQLLRDRSTLIQQPVWLNAEVVQGPNQAQSTELNATAFLYYVDEIFPHATISLGWTSLVRFADDQNEEYTWKSMDEMMKILQRVSQRTTLLARGALLRDSWDKFLWLLEQSDSYLLTVVNEDLDTISVEDMLFFRDNLEISRVFYDTTNKTMMPFKAALESRTLPKVFYTGGNVLEYFRIPDRAAIKITWMHRVVGKEELNFALSNDTIKMLEADVRLAGEGTTNVNDTLPVMAHDLPVRNYDFTLREWMNEVISNNATKGIKLDFKTIGAVEASVGILKELKPLLTMPIWINADIKKGPNSMSRPVDAASFLTLFEGNFPYVTLSLGWTTTYRYGRENENYTQEMMEEMYDTCMSLRQAITFPARASLTRKSIPQFQWLLSKSNRYSITVWHSTSETVQTEDLLEIYNSFPTNKVFFDIPAEMMARLQAAINAQLYAE